ncbi:transposase [Nitrosomonas sp. Nm34]|uniref:transposase n=1 Tax=Nitrosomonas sp. Nm34 TaxID=1881055 RepID=UPI00111438AF
MGDPPQKRKGIIPDFNDAVQLVIKVRKNMKNRLLLLFGKFLLRKPLIIETHNDL